MNAGLGTFVLLAISLLLANLPFLSERLFGLLRLARKKGLALRLLEVVLAYFLVGGISLLIETQRFGSVFPQGWEFYAVTACLFLVFAYPGFVRHTLWRNRQA
ncbi:DUF2818 family protein [Niveibacterium sp. SC-1]|uniref:DUF2818 family protein n=1 Tax=Niveibacterium sp. SC-1 TaxID=3135646 RepID=UPI00311FCDD5